MKISQEEKVDAEAGKTIYFFMKRVLPTHFKESQAGAVLSIENLDVWVYVEDWNG